MLSLLDPGKRPFLHPRFDRANWLLIHCEDDIDEGTPRGPKMEHVVQLLEWAKQLPDDAVVLVHCEAGVSRSTAAALAILVQHHGLDKLDDCISLLLEVRPQACPNPVITKYADQLLGCDGRLHDVAEIIAKNKLFPFLK